jgi:hypothetical protein
MFIHHAVILPAATTSATHVLRQAGAITIKPTTICDCVMLYVHKINPLCHLLLLLLLLLLLVGRY